MSGEPTFVGTGLERRWSRSVSDGPSTVTFDGTHLPAGTVDGDRLFVAIRSQNFSGVLNNNFGYVSITPPLGWTSVATVGVGDGTGTRSSGISYFSAPYNAVAFPATFTYQIVANTNFTSNIMAFMAAWSPAWDIYPTIKRAGWPPNSTPVPPWESWFYSDAHTVSVPIRGTVAVFAAQGNPNLGTLTTVADARGFTEQADLTGLFMAGSDPAVGTAYGNLKIADFITEAPWVGHPIIWDKTNTFGGAGGGAVAVVMVPPQGRCLSFTGLITDIDYADNIVLSVDSVGFADTDLSHYTISFTANTTGHSIDPGGTLDGGPWTIGKMDPGTHVGYVIQRNDNLPMFGSTVMRATDTPTGTDRYATVGCHPSGGWTVSRPNIGSGWVSDIRIIGPSVRR